MSSVWETRYRLLLEQLEELANQLRSKGPVDPPALEEQTMRLLIGVITLLRQHPVDKRGQCKYCGRTKRRWRFWRRRPQCTVRRSLDFAMRQPLDVVSFLFFQRSPGFPSEEGNHR